jgi:hypothetical protein
VYPAKGTEGFEVRIPPEPALKDGALCTKQGN